MCLLVLLVFRVSFAQADLTAAAVTGRSSLPPAVERERRLAEDEHEALEECECGVGPTSLIAKEVHYLRPRQWWHTRRLLYLY